MIPKKNRPTATDLRPIALTSTSYKQMMTVLKEQIFEFISKNELINDMQTGGTKGRRATENIYMLNYCIENSIIQKKKLYILCIDFSKAYDSIDRLSLIEALKDIQLIYI